VKNNPGNIMNVAEVKIIFDCFIRGCLRQAKLNTRLLTLVEGKNYFGVWPKRDYLTFFEGGLLCIEN